MGNGVYFSADRGSHWQLVPFTQGIPAFNDIHWKSATTAILASAGRGLWELTLNATALLNRVPDACPDCRFTSVSAPQGGGDPIFGGGIPVKDAIGGNTGVEDAVLVFDGRVNGVVAGQRGTVQAGVTPGSSVMQFRTGQLQVPVELVEQPKPGSFASLPLANQIQQGGFLLRGFTFAKGTLTGILFGNGFAPAPSAEHIPTQKLPTSRTLGLDGKPYLWLGGADMRGISRSE